MNSNFLSSTRLIILWLHFCIIDSHGYSQSIRINEFSQGSGGSKEWVELVVMSSTPVDFTNCVLQTVNIGRWIIDDNNGDFSPPNHFTGSGIAQGHLRLKNQIPWTEMPVGSIIVIYNAALGERDEILPPDDPLDINFDCVYILPSNHSSLEYCTSTPIASDCTTPSNYTGCSYVTGTAVNSWGYIGLANAGDAIQVRNPAFGLIHGVVYGKSTSVSGCTTTPDMIGGMLAPLISNLNMGGNSATFTGSSDADYFDATKWLIQTAAAATPGAFNNAANQNYIVNTLRGGCTCNRILPFYNEDNKNISRLINQKYDRIIFLNGIINSEFYNKAYKLNIYIYNVDGKLTYKETVHAKASSKIDLNPYLNKGINLIKVVADITPYKIYTFKTIH